MVLGAQSMVLTPNDTLIQTQSSRMESFVNLNFGLKDTNEWASGSISLNQSVLFFWNIPVKNQEVKLR